ncbi:MAG: pyridoxal 5'-phosphate synthase glutaminase subunit PdxT [Actinobacteria bacterium]|nr:pyridoxal 5'-phosphate synthase glutaminase subunit PdxT [Actinomycetota bacterium]
MRWSGRDWVPGERLSGRTTAPEFPADAPVVGVLALQGDVLEHLRALARCGARPVRVRRVADLEHVDGLIVPGGESTTIGKLLVRAELLEPLRERITGGLPTFGTCAGMILLSRELDQEAPQPLLGVLGVRTRRNAFGRQVDSFDTSLAIAGVAGEPMDVSFIRAPWVEEVLDGDVEVLASVDGKPVVVRQGHVLATAFHPEVTGDDRLHQRFVDDLR